MMVHFRFPYDFDHDALRQRLKQSIQRLTGFTADRQNQLEDYFLQKLQYPEPIAVVKAEIEQLSQHKQQQISHIMVKILFADGDIPVSAVLQNTIKNYQALYLSLGLESDMLMQDIEQLFSNNKTQEAGFFLDKAVVETQELQTEAAQTLLHHVFDHTTQTHPIAPLVTHNELDAKHKQLYQHLITDNEWSSAALKQIANQYKLPMIHGMIAKINRWACEYVGYSVFITHQQGVSVDTEIVTAINNQSGEI